MIIIEGADGTGKTTLVNKLSADYGLRRLPRAADSLSGPLCSIGAWELQLPANHHLCIADRHPVISGLVYDQIFGRNFYAATYLYELYSELKAGLHYLFIAAPGYYKTRQRLKNCPQMPGVLDNFNALYWLYNRLSIDLHRLDIPYFVHGQFDYTTLEAYLEST